MLLHEIIAENEDPKYCFQVEILAKYKRSLLTYYRAQFNCEPCLMVTDVFNAVQFAKIVPINELYDAICASYAGAPEDLEDYVELVSFQSILLNQL